MRRNKFGTYLLYAAVLLAAVAAMSVGSTHARTSAGAVTVLDPLPTEEVSTGVLSADGSSVYLSDWYIAPEATVEPTATPEPTPTPETETEPVPETEPTPTPEPTPEPTPSPPPTRRVTFTVPDETALTSEFSLSADGLLDPELEVENGTVTLTLRATDAVRSLTDRTYSTVTVFWNGLSADFQVPLITSPMDPASGASAELSEYTENALAFLACGLPEDCRMRVTDIGGKPVSGLRFSVDGGQTWSLLYGAYECPLGLSGSGCVLLDFTDVTFRNGLRVTVDGAELLSETAPLPDAGTDRTPAVLTGAGERFTVALDPAWLGCDLELGLYRLERTETGSEWLPADQPLPDVTLEQDALTVSLPEERDRVPAGSWRLTLAWTSGDTVMYETELRFFVLYTAAG